MGEGGEGGVLPPGARTVCRAELVDEQCEAAVLRGRGNPVQCSWPPAQRAWPDCYSVGLVVSTHQPCDHALLRDLALRRPSQP